MAKKGPFEKHVGRYEAWFEKYPRVYDAELRAVRELVPEKAYGLEVGAGTGRFAVPLGIEAGVEPSVRMAEMARRRGMSIVGGVGENLPLKDIRFDFLLLVTTVCFLDDIGEAFKEARRVLREQGLLIVGLVDRESPLGRIYSAHRNENVFYREARFWSVDEIVRFMEQSGFRDFHLCQTIFQGLSELGPTEPVMQGHGQGSFVVIRGRKK
jgi:SAM-dependent methyltransferase